MFLRQLLNSMDLLQSTPPMPIHCDNDTATKLTEDSVWHPNVKHFRVKYHTMCNHVRAGEIRVVRVPSAGNVADIFTKALGQSDFQHLCLELGIRSSVAEPGTV